MTFFATELEIDPAYGWQGGPDVDVLIRQLRNKHERRNRRGDLAQHRYTLPLQNVSDVAYRLYIKSAFLALGGPHHSFLVKDWSDFAAVDEAFGTGDGAETEFQLSKTSAFGLASYTRVITKPVFGVVVKVNGVATAATVNTLTGVVTFAAPPELDAVLTWTGEFRVPVRFEAGFLPTTIDNRHGANYATNSTISLVEVFGE